MKKKIVYIILFVSLFFISCNNVFAYNNTGGKKVSCGNGMISNIPSSLPRVVSIIYIALQIAVPVLLVIFGSIDLVKALTAGKEEDIKKAQSTLIRRVLTGTLVFALFAFTKLLVYAFGNNTGKVTQCMNCFLNYNSNDKKAGACDANKK